MGFVSGLKKVGKVAAGFAAGGVGGAALAARKKREDKEPISSLRASGAGATGFRRISDPSMPSPERQSQIRGSISDASSGGVTAHVSRRREENERSSTGMSFGGPTSARQEEVRRSLSNASSGGVNEAIERRRRRRDES